MCVASYKRPRQHAVAALFVKLLRPRTRPPPSILPTPIHTHTTPQPSTLTHTQTHTNEPPPSSPPHTQPLCLCVAYVCVTVCPPPHTQEDYSETLSFLVLINALLATIGPTGLPEGALGIHHYTQFVLQHVVGQLWQRGYK